MRPFRRCTRLVLLAAPLLAVLAAGCAAPPREATTLGGESRLRVAQAAEESGDLGLAEQMYAAASQAAPKDAAVQLHYADVLVRRGRIGEARNLLQGHLQTVSDPRQLRDGLGCLHVLAGEPARAIAEFDHSLADHPDDLRALVNKGVALDLLGRHGEAQELYRRALVAQPGDAAVINDLALSMLLAGRAREAGELAAPLGEQSDVPPRIRAGMGVVLAAGGRIDEARAMAGATVSESQLLQLSRAAAAR